MYLFKFPRYVFVCEFRFVFSVMLILYMYSINSSFFYFKTTTQSNMYLSKFIGNKLPNFTKQSQIQISNVNNVTGKIFTKHSCGFFFTPEFSPVSQTYTKNLAETKNNSHSVK